MISSMSILENDNNSIKLSRDAESDWSLDVTGLIIFNSSLVNSFDSNLDSADFKEFKLPCNVLISPLWEINLNGWANFQDGNVFVENLECTIEKQLSKRWFDRSG